MAAQPEQPLDQHEARPMIHLNVDEVQQELDKRLEEAEGFEKLSLQIAREAHRQFIDNGETVREMADLLHGKFVGHPLHPILTTVTVGSWTLGVFFDVMSIVTGSDQFQQTGDQLTLLGTLAAVPTALTGFTDFSAIKQDTVSHGALHGLLNSVALLCYVRSVIARATHSRGAAIFFALVGWTCAGVSAWLGGDLSYRHRVGINHTPEPTVTEWTEVMSLADLDDQTPTRVTVEEDEVLLIRQGDNVYATSAICSHAGAPLDEGRIVDETCIECPWHHSVFDAKDGHVVHSPAAIPLPEYEVRLRDGLIDVRATV
jgi:nitrite reductase/ring-hydroxylating ferredoxin subunit/uncharacterized membrane protein